MSVPSGGEAERPSSGHGNVTRGRLFPDRDRPLAVVSTVTRWNELPRFRHQVTRQLARFYNVLYVEQGAPQRADEAQQSAFERVADRIVVFRPPRAPGALRRTYLFLPPVHDVFDRHARHAIERAVRDEGYDKAVLVNFRFDDFAIMSSPVLVPRVYLCNDEFPDSAARAWQRRLFRYYERRTAKAATLCIVHSKPLQEKLRRFNADVRVLLPGHEFDLSNMPHAAGRAGRADGRIAVGYMGFINERLRFDWLAAVAGVPEMELHLIGPVSPTLNRSVLPSGPSCYYAGELRGEALYRALCQMDVLVIPFDTRSAVVRACTPNKLFPYLASGKPVVVSDMRQLGTFPVGFVYEATDAISFVRVIREAHCDDNEVWRRARLACAKANSWDSRGDELHRMLCSLSPTLT